MGLLGAGLAESQNKKLNWGTEMRESDRERDRERETQRKLAVRREEQSIKNARGRGQAQKLLARIKDESGW